MQNKELNSIQHLYIECTHTSGTTLNTGIQRVVRKVINHLGPELDDNTPVTLVIIHEGAFYPLEFLPDLPKKKKEPVSTRKASYIKPKQKISFKTKLITLIRSLRKSFTSYIKWRPLHHFFSAPRAQFGLSCILYKLSLIGVYRNYKYRKAQKELLNTGASYDSPIEFGKGDVILMLDSSWHLNAWAAISNAKKNDAKVIGVIYDLIPITHSQFCLDALCEQFSSWFEQGSVYIDGYIAISKTVQQNVHDYLKSIVPSIEKQKIGYFYLGADMAKQEGVPRDELKEAISQQDSYLVVSTIEPRKNHQYILDTFSELWEQGYTTKLHIVGRVGWDVDELIKQIKQHTQYNKLLFLWNDLDDSELVYCYKNSKALVFASFVEGFGLPIIEAQYFNLPVLVSDIAIHREIGANSVLYFDIEQQHDLVNKVIQIEQNELALIDGKEFDFEQFTWQQSTKQLTSEIQRLANLN